MKENAIKDYILISDIHSRKDGIIKAIKIAQEFNKKILIVGDLFDRGQEFKEVLDILYDDIDNIEFILGNHDDLLYQALDIQAAVEGNMTNVIGTFLANDYKNYTLKGIFSNSDVFSPNLIYNKDFKEALKKENIENIEKLEMIALKTMFNKSFNYKDLNISLSHSGNYYNKSFLIEEKDNIQVIQIESLWGLEPTMDIINYRKANNILEICGHWSAPHLITYLQDNLIDFAFIDDSIYIPDWNGVYIDNMRGDNIVNLETLVKRIYNKDYKLNKDYYKYI